MPGISHSGSSSSVSRGPAQQQRREVVLGYPRVADAREPSSNGGGEPHRVDLRAEHLSQHLTALTLDAALRRPAADDPGVVANMVRHADGGQQVHEQGLGGGTGQQCVEGGCVDGLVVTVEAGHRVEDRLAPRVVEVFADDVPARLVSGGLGLEAGREKGKLRAAVGSNVAHWSKNPFDSGGSRVPSSATSPGSGWRSTTWSGRTLSGWSAHRSPLSHVAGYGHNSAPFAMSIGA